jgi:hypothetical protein
MDARDPTTSLSRVSLAASGGVSRLRAVDPPEARVRARLGFWGAGKGLGGLGGDVANITMGTTLAQKHWMVAVHGRVARRQRSSTLASNCAHKVA